MIRNKWFWIISSVLAGLIILAAIILYTPISSEYLTGQISAKLSEKLGSKVSIGKATVMVAKEVELRDITIEREDKTTVAVEDFSLNYQFLPLLRKRLIGRGNSYGVDISLRGKSAEGLDLVSGALGWDKGAPMHFSHISWDIWSEDDTVAIKNLRAEGAELKIIAEGVLREGKKLNCEYQVFFRKAEDVLPEGLKKLFIRDNESGWLGLSSKLNIDIGKGL